MTVCRKNLSRRTTLQVGGLSAMGFGLCDLFRAQKLGAAETAPAPKAKACILIWLEGGPSHLDLFDPKPDAPAEVRGPLGSIATKLPGVRFGECLSRTAGLTDHLAVVRSMTSPLGEHNFGTHYLMTGYKPSPAVEYPTFGATVAKLRGGEGVLPPHISVPGFSKNVSGNGYLPNSTRPFIVGSSQGRPDFSVRDLDFYPGLDLTRLDRRRQFAQMMNEMSDAKMTAANGVVDSDLQRAYELVASAEAKSAFDLSAEPVEVRRRYGMEVGNGIGQGCLMARRLVQRGVPFVTVHNPGWDTHQDIVKLKERYSGDQGAQLPLLDKALSALIEDLSQSGLLDETLVVVMGEFGRTPKINSNGGRDHWPNVFSVALAGGGVRGGQVIGSSDALGEFPKDGLATPGDLATTIYTLLGISPDHELRTSDGRPVRVAPDGAKLIDGLIA